MSSNAPTTQTDALTWLMAGDPAIRWQTQRDLLHRPAKTWQAERQLTLSEGWGARLLALQAPDGSWGGGIYSPKWTSTTYTLLMLCDIGIPRESEAGRRGAALVLDTLLGEADDEAFRAKLAACDRCIVGMILQLAAYFGLSQDDGRIHAIVQNLLDELMPDGAWNCRRTRKPYPTHSSFHTTFNVLEGLREYVESRPARQVHQRAAILQAEHSALELMLQHQLYRSDKTGRIINEKFTRLSFPHRWHYDILRGLAYFARIDAPRDPRLQEAIDLLRSYRREDGTWPVQNLYTGKVFFNMESVGKPSRWNTLRALRVLNWWDGTQN